MQYIVYFAVQFLLELSRLMSFQGIFLDLSYIKRDWNAPHKSF